MLVQILDPLLPFLGRQWMMQQAVVPLTLMGETQMQSLVLGFSLAQNIVGISISFSLLSFCLSNNVNGDIIHFINIFTLIHFFYYQKMNDDFLLLPRTTSEIYSKFNLAKYKAWKRFWNAGFLINYITTVYLFAKPRWWKL